MSISSRRADSFASGVWAVRLFALFLLLLLAGEFGHTQAAGIALVQHTGKDGGTTTSTTLAFPNSNTAGNFIAVVIRGGLSKTQVFTVSDSLGNTYRQAAQLGSNGSAVTSAIYYAENIKAGANTVSVSMTVSGPLRLAILEYSGVATSGSLDATAVNTTTSTAPNSGTLTTTANGDLLLAMVSTADSDTFAAGTGYTVRDFVPAEPNTKLISEDQVQTAAGPASATASLTVSSNWGTILAAFKPVTGGGGSGTPASITATAGTPQSATVNAAFATQLQATVKDSSNNPVSGVTVTFAVPGSGASGAFVGGVTTATTNASGVATAAVFTANTTAGAYTVTASVAGVSTPATFSMANLAGPPASITAAAGTPQSATVNSAFAVQLQATVKDSFNNPVSGAMVTFAAPGSGASGTFAGGVNTATTNASGVATAAVFTANSTAGAYAVSASVSGVASPANFSLTNLAGAAASITSTGGTPQNANINSAFAVQLQATVKDSFSNPVSGATVTFAAPGSGASGTFAGGVNTATTNASGVATAAVFTANGTAGSYTVTATVSGVASAANFSLTNLVPPPSISGLNPTSGPVGTSVTITGTNFGASQGTSTVTFNGTAAGPTGWSNTSIVVQVPSGATSGNVVVTVGGVQSNGVAFTVTVAPVISSLSPTSGSVGAPVVILGTGFGFSPGSNIVTFNGTPATVTSQGPSQINVTVPAGATTGNVIVTTGGLASNPVNFTVTVISVSVSPATVTVPLGGAAGYSVTVQNDVPNLNPSVRWSLSGAGCSGATCGSFSGAASAYQITYNAPSVLPNPPTVTLTVTSIADPTKSATSTITLTSAPWNFTATAGTPQSATINTAFATQLQTTLKDSLNNPISGVTVNFAVSVGGASGTFAGGVTTVTATTDTSGVATAAVFTANSIAGSYTVTASVAGVSTLANFSLTNVAGSPASITATAGTPQNATINTAFAKQLQATVKDASNNPVSGATVTFTAPSSGASGTFAGGITTATTNVFGVATAPVFTANATVGGSYTVTASVAGVVATANFSLTNLAAPPASVTATAGTPQSASVGTAFTTALQVTVKDASNNPVSGATVTFAAPSSGASGTFAGGVTTASTDASGVATAAVFTANSTAGGPYTVTASVFGISTPANFSLTNLAGPPASITATAGTPQNATINTAFATQLQATVKDSSNNPVSGVTVAFSAPSSGASGTFAGGATTATTNASGVATAAVFTANGTAGPYTVTASVAGVSASANFSLTNLAPPPASIIATAGTPQSANVSTTFTTALQVTVNDASNNPVNGVTVTFSAPSNGASGTFAGGVNTATTNASGVATAPVFTANSIAGAYTVTASVAGVSTPVNFSLTNLAASPASITATAGTPQNATVNAAFATQLQATVKDSSNNPVNGVTVTFAAPSSGASGTFAGGVNTATTNASGVATAPVFTANNTAGAYTVTASVAGVPAPANFSLTNLSNAPAKIALVQHTGKDGGTTTSTTLAFPSSNTSGNFIAVVIRGGLSSSQIFTVKDSLGNTYKQAAQLGSNGSAVTSAIYYAENIKAGANTITVSMTVSGPLRLAILEYSGVATSGSLDVTSINTATSVAPSSGTLTTTASGDLLLAMVATADSDTFAAGTGYTVRDFVPAEPNTKLISEDQVQTAAGPASATATLTVSSNWGAILAAFKAATGGGGTGTPASITATAGTPQSAVINAAFATQLQATVKDSSNNPVSGVTVTFAAPGSGASGTFAGGVTTATTNASGVATAAVFTANSTAGAYTVMASVAGVSTPANFSLTNLAGPPASIAATAGTPQNGLINNAFATQLQATVKDSSNNPVSGVTITFTAPGSGAGGTFAGGVNTATTNASGVATAAVFTANSIAGGPYTVTASAVGVSTPANFSLTNLATAAANIALVQHKNIDSAPTNSNALAFTTNTTAGNWIAVSIRGGLSNSQVFTVSDSSGNTFHQAFRVGFTVNPATIALYYAENIKGGPDTITVTQSVFAPLRFAILEYSGVALSNSLDGTPVTAQGQSANPNSGNLTTSANGDLLLATIETQNNAAFTAGTGYSIEESVPASPNTRLVAEDQLQRTAGTASAGASLAAADNWGAGLAAFRSMSGTISPISVSLSPATVSLSSGYGTQAFAATVTNDFLNQGVTWSLSGAGCSGSACGTLSRVTTTSVTYTAPQNIPNPATVTLTATSIGDATKSASAVATVTQGVLTIVVSPKRAAVTVSSAPVQFTANVYNDPSNSGVTWQVDGNFSGNSVSGTVSATGLYTPGTQPGQHTVSAISNANASVSGSAFMALTDLSGVYTHHNDNARTGQNLKEYALTPATVNSTSFGQLFSCPVDGFVYAQPLWVAGLTFGTTVRNVVIVATEHNSVYAFDADSPSCVQLWRTNFLATGVTTLTSADVQANTDIVPEIGITSTPVIDPSTNTVYVVPKTRETVGTVSGQACSTNTPCYVHRLHALDLITGAEKFGGPVVIAAPNFTPLKQLQRPALLLANNTLYLAFGSHGDQCPYQGWVIAYNPATLAQSFANSLSDSSSGCNQGAIWQSGAGPAADANGNVYVVTGNGLYDGTLNFGDSVVKLSPTGSVLDWFTPFDQGILAANDVDLGSAGVLILPDSVGSTAHPHLALIAGKISILYLLDQNNMGKFNSSTNSDVQEVVPVPPPNTTLNDGGNYAVPAYWNGNLYTVGQNFPLSQFQISNGVISTPQAAVSNNLFPPRGGVPAVSANGTAGGIVWIIDYTGWQNNTPSILDAYDATNVGTLLFSSPASGAGAAGAGVKWSVPTVANGKVYIGTQFFLNVYGLLPN